MGLYIIKRAYTLCKVGTVRCVPAGRLHIGRVLAWTGVPDATERYAVVGHGGRMVGAYAVTNMPSSDGVDCGSNHVYFVFKPHFKLHEQHTLRWLCSIVAHDVRARHMGAQLFTTVNATQKEFVNAYRDVGFVVCEGRFDLTDNELLLMMAE